MNCIFLTFLVVCHESIDNDCTYGPMPLEMAQSLRYTLYVLVLYYKFYYHTIPNISFNNEKRGMDSLQVLYMRLWYLQQNK